MVHVSAVNQYESLTLLLTVLTEFPHSAQTFQLVGLWVFSLSPLRRSVPIAGLLLRRTTVRCWVLLHLLCLYFSNEKLLFSCLFIYLCFFWRNLESFMTCMSRGFWDFSDRFWSLISLLFNGFWLIIVDLFLSVCSGLWVSCLNSKLSGFVLSSTQFSCSYLPFSICLVTEKRKEK